MPQRIYKEMDIDLSSDMKFMVSDRRRDISEDDRMSFNGHYDTYESARDAIDRRLKAAEALSQKSLETRPVLAEHTDQTLLVRALHASRGHVLFTPPQKDIDVHSVYPNVSWIKELLDERRACVVRMAEIQAALKPYRVSTTGSYYGRYSDEPADRYAEIIKAIDEATKKAKDVALTKAGALA